MPRAYWLLLLVLPLGAYGEQWYVIDRLYVNLREDVTEAAAVLKTLESGALVEVLERSGGLVRVRDKQGSEGWLDSRYIGREPPARLQSERAQAELVRTREQLSKAQAELKRTAGHTVAQAPTPELQQELNKARAEVASLRAELKDAQASLAREVAKTSEFAASSKNAAANRPSGGEPENRSGSTFIWLALAFAMLVIGFVGGIVWVRESIRRRMGGMYLRM